MTSTLGKGQFVADITNAPGMPLSKKIHLKSRLDIHLEVLPMVQQDCIQEDCNFGSRYKDTSVFQHGAYIL